jgi:predicted O-linked N-acetylglucosamine transferase (SPINDLY family)
LALIVARGKLEEAIVELQAGRLANAEHLCREVLDLESSNAEALHLLGIVANRQGRHEAAIELIEKAAARQPTNAVFLSNLGNAVSDAGRIEQAAECYRRALALEPAFADAHGNLGNALMKLNQPAPAEQCFRQALQLRPGDAELYRRLGRALVAQQRLEAAEPNLRRALALDPAHWQAAVNLANLLKDLGQLQESAAVARRVLERKPDFAEAHLSLANALMYLGRLEEAERHCRRALELNASLPEGHFLLGNLFTFLARIAEAVQSYRQALSLRPSYAAAHSNLIFALDMLDGASAREQQAERAHWYKQHAKQYAPRKQRHANSPDPERRLRLGYVSADFYRHSACYMFGPVIRRHDPAAFEVFCYSGVRRGDEVTAQLKESAQGWRDCASVSDDELAEQIQRDEIDILIDLSGHSAGNRLTVFARKPAPLQVTAWGHATGTGISGIDYLLADRILIPKKDRQYYAEEVLDLSCCGCYEPPSYLPDVSQLPAIAARQVTFGCINRLEKISPRAIELWGRLLAAIPEAQLLIKARALEDQALKQRLLAALASAGVAAGRVRLRGGSPHAEHLRTYDEIDIALDPFPQNGGVSTVEALWMGVPVVTLLGATVPSRVSAAYLTAAGMSDWIARDESQYVAIARDAADKPRSLGRLRAALRGKVRKAVMSRPEAYTREVEETYRAMWRKWCRRVRRA